MDTVKKCVVIGAGPIYSPKPPRGDGSYVIAVDGGYERLKRLRLEADLVIGDFDSLERVPEHPNVIRLEKEKDDTDTLAALRRGLDIGCREFHIYGGTGGRFDHTLANLQCLAWLEERGAQGFLMGDGCASTCVRGGGIEFGSGYRGLVSVFSVSCRSTGVNLRGLKYPLVDAELTSTHPLGVSNEFIGEKSRISAQSGTLLIVFPYNGREALPCRFCM